MTLKLKNTSLRIAIISLAFMAVLVTGCSKSDGSTDPSPIQVRTNILTSGAWSLATIKVDGVVRQDLYPSDGMGLTFTDSNFSTVNGSPFFPVQGVWSFQDSDARLLRIGDLSTTVLSLSTSSLVIQF